MKRSPSRSLSDNAPSPFPIETGDKKPHLAPNKKSKPTPPSTPKKTKLNPSSTSPSTSHWTPNKKERFLDKIFSLEVKSCNVDEMCEEFGLTKLQFRNATQAGRKGNLRDKACKGIRGD